MADPLEAFSEAFNQSMGRERELSNKMKMLKYQSTLEAQQPSPEMRLFDLFKSDPETFKSYMRAKDPLDAFYKQGMLNYYMGNLGVEKDKLKLLEQGTGKQRDYGFLMGLPGMTQEKALQFLYRPDLMQQLLGSGLFGAPNQNNSPQPQNQNGLFTK